MSCVRLVAVFDVTAEPFIIHTAVWPVETSRSKMSDFPSPSKSDAGNTAVLASADFVLLVSADELVVMITASAHADVLNVASTPFVVPSEFVAFTLK